MKFKTDNGEVDTHPKTITEAQAKEMFHGNPVVITDKVVGIINQDCKAYMDSPEDFLKMLDNMRDWVVNELPKMDVKQMFFIICDTGLQVMIDSGQPQTYDGTTQ